MLRSVLSIGIVMVALACGRDDASTARSDATPADGAGTTATRSPDTAATPTASGATARSDEKAGDAPTIVFLGNSLTAGYGLAAEQAYPALIRAKLDSAGYRYRVVNAGVSGETSAGGLARIDWLLRQPIEILVLALGANDMLRGHDLANTRRNLQEIIDRIRARYPDAEIVIAGMLAPPNLGAAYTETFRELFVDLARANDAALIPFLLEGVAMVPELNQSDRIHPNAAGQRIVAENVWRVLEPVVRRRSVGRATAR